MGLSDPSLSHLVQIKLQLSMLIAVFPEKVLYRNIFRQLQGRSKILLVSFVPKTNQLKIVMNTLEQQTLRPLNSFSQCVFWGTVLTGFTYRIISTEISLGITGLDKDTVYLLQDISASSICNYVLRISERGVQVFQIYLSRNP